jgi:hypothetical protein
MEPKRCGNCGQVTVCASTVCPACHQPRLRALSDEELRAWQRHSDLEEADRARAVAVQCELVTA